MLRGNSGFTLIETLGAMVFSALAAGLLLGGLGAVRDRALLLHGRGVAVGAMVEARRLAYTSAAAVNVTVSSGAPTLSVGSRSIALPAGVSVVDGPADGVVTFRASGFADNATVRLGSRGGQVDIVVNQRGLIR